MSRRTPPPLLRAPPTFPIQCVRAKLPPLCADGNGRIYGCAGLPFVYNSIHTRKPGVAVALGTLKSNRGRADKESQIYLQSIFFFELLNACSTTVVVFIA